ncbi:hypothetical protein QJQ45_019944 [Haematococcus lacustris]|nr:hypothetical protein QJQ45_019944 [Haematococcus lacustris]
MLMLFDSQIFRMEMRVAIVGSGLTGAVAASTLAKRGVTVTLFDLGRNSPGGRAASRTLGRHAGAPSLDMGAQAIPPPRSPAFVAMLRSWEETGLVQPWSGRFGFITDQGLQVQPAAAEPSCGGTPAASFFDCQPQRSDCWWVGVPSMASLVSGLIASQPSIRLRLATKVVAAHLHALPLTGLPSPSASEQAAGEAAPATWLPGTAEGVAPAAAPAAAAAALHAVTASGKVGGQAAGASLELGRGQQSGRQQAAVWRLSGQGLGELGEFDALILTDAMTARPGSPGYVAISIDPSLQASHFGPLTSLHPTPADISSSPSGTMSGAAAAADGRGAEAGAGTQDGDSASSGGELDLDCSSGQAAQAASRPLAAPHPAALGNPSLASVVQAMLARVAALSRVPLFTLMASFPASTSAQPLLPVAAAVAHHSCSSGLAWVSVDSSKPGRDSPQTSSALAPTLVAVSTPAFAQQLLDLDPALAPPTAPCPTTPTTTTTPTQGHLTQSSLGDSSSSSSNLGQGPDAVGQAGSTSRGVGAALPPQTPDYLLPRAQAMLGELQALLARTPGSAPLPTPLTFTAHRWGSAHVADPLGVPCLAVACSSSSSSSSSSSRPPLPSSPLSSAVPCPPSATAATTGEGAQAGWVDGGQGLPAAAAAPACFVIAGDFCHRAPGSGAPGLEDAACSGQAAAEAVMCGAW